MLTSPFTGIWHRFVISFIFHLNSTASIDEHLVFLHSDYTSGDVINGEYLAAGAETPGLFVLT